MTPKAKSTALILSGAVALSFTAYAIGSQSGDGNADAPIAGFDVAVTGGDGRLRSVLGFLDRVPAGSAA